MTRDALVSGGSLSTMGGMDRLPAAVSMLRSLVSGLTFEAVAAGGFGGCCWEYVVAGFAVAFVSAAAFLLGLFLPVPPPSTFSPSAFRIGSPIPPGPLTGFLPTNGLGTLGGDTGCSNG